MADDPISDLNTPNSDPPKRKVYESTLFPQRKRRRVSPWLAIPSLLVALIAILYVVLVLPRHRRVVETAGKIVYVSDARSPGVSHLWIANFDGSGARPLTSGAFTESDPAFSADGSQIAFLSNRSGGVKQIYVMDADGQSIVQVTRTSGAKASPRFAPGSNTLLAFLSGGALADLNITSGNADLLLPAATGNNRPQSTDTSQPDQSPSTVTDYAWMPALADSNTHGLAAVEDNNGVQTLAVLPDLSGPARETQTGQPGGPPLAEASALSVGWSPDGSTLAVAMLAIQGIRQSLSGLIAADAQGKLTHPLFTPIADKIVGPQNPVYSPDGAFLVFEVWSQPDLASRQRLGLYSIPGDGSAPPRPLVRGDAEDAHFSPDSQQLFFLARRPDGGRDLCRINRDGSGFKRLTQGSGDVSGYDISPQSLPK